MAMPRNVESSSEEGDISPTATASTPSRSPRIVAHFDLDAFYVGCERELNPSALLGVPVAVSQYNPYGSLRETSPGDVGQRLIVRPGGIDGGDDGDTNGSLIAVSYEARAMGVRRNDRGRDAVLKCPDLRIVQVPVRHGKADLTMYRDASHRVLRRLARSIRDSGGGPTTVSKEAASRIRVEKASIDEIYIDLTSAATEMAGKVAEERNQLCRSRKRRRTSSGAKLGMEQLHEKPGSINRSSSSYWKEIICTSGPASCTTIGGVEEVDANALAANILSKEDLRRGSSLQVADSSSAAAALDRGSKSWWDRDLAEWTDLEIALACGAALAARARADVALHFAAGNGGRTLGETFTLSAGVSTNKTLSKLASGMKKPNRQTIINPDDEALQKLFHPLPVGRIRGLGGKFGVEICEKLKIETVGDLARVRLTDIERHYPPSPDNRTAQFLHNISRGICLEEVEDRTLAKSIGCGKTFRNQLALDPSDKREVRRWAGELCGELTERLRLDRRENLRTPKLVGVSVRTSDKKRVASKSTPAPRTYDKYAETATKLIAQVVGLSRSKIEGLTVFASNFVEVADESSSIMAAFGRAAKSTGKGIRQPATSKPSPTSKLIQQKRERKVSLRALWSAAKADEDNAKSKKAADNADSKVHGSCAQPDGSDRIDVDIFSHLPRSTQEEIRKSSCAQPDGSDHIDADVFSQLPRSIQEEIRQSHNAFRSVQTDELKPAKTKTGINGWLSKGNGSKYAAGVDAQANSRVIKRSALPEIGDIDQGTLEELPSDIREAVMRDIYSTTQTRKNRKRAGIENFFSRK